MRKGGLAKQEPRPASEVATVPAVNLQGRPITTGQKLAIRALHDSGMSMEAIAAQEKISLGSVSAIINDPELAELHHKPLEGTKKSLAGRCYNLADRALSHVSEDKLSKMNAYQLTSIAAINIDKARLMDNLSTENISVRGVVAEAANDIAELRRKRARIDPSQSE